MIKQINDDNNCEGLDFNSNGNGFVEDDGIACATFNDWHNSFQRMAEDIVRTFKPKRVLEFGSGAGNLSYHIRETDPSIIYVSVDINKKSPKSPWYKGNNSHHFTSYTNRPIHFIDDTTNETIKFDLFLSFEHFEHIPQSTFDVLLENVKRHMHKDSLALTTACIEVRPDGSHVNIKSKKEWIKYLTDQGFHVYDSSIINLQNQPFNIYGLWENTHELMFKLKPKDKI